MEPTSIHKGNKVTMRNGVISIPSFKKENKHQSSFSLTISQFTSPSHQKVPRKKSVYSATSLTLISLLISTPFAHVVYAEESNVGGISDVTKSISISGKLPQPDVEQKEVAILEGEGVTEDTNTEQEGDSLVQTIKSGSEEDSTSIQALKEISSLEQDKNSFSQNNMEKVTIATSTKIVEENKFNGALPTSTESTTSTSTATTTKKILIESATTTTPTIIVSTSTTTQTTNATTLSTTIEQKEKEVSFLINEINSTSSTTEANQSSGDLHFGDKTSTTTLEKILQNEANSPSLDDRVSQIETSIVPQIGEKDELESTPEFNILDKFNFTDRDCTFVNNDQLYCIRASSEYTAGAGDLLTSANDRVFVERDNEEGDKEIYFKEGSSIVRITDNEYDDMSPAYDDKNLLIVWQALINDRWQIMLYDLRLQKTVELTNYDFNNTNPSISQGMIVWQGWERENWEIFFVDGVTGADDPALETITKITQNSWHDMFPQVKGRYVVWKGYVNGGWRVFVFNIDTRVRSEVPEGSGLIENPRFALLLDDKKEDGSTETIGYDLVSGEVVRFGNSGNQKTPVQIPEIPLQSTDKALPLSSGDRVASSTKTQDENSGDE